ncbi:hypothetical protein GH714_014759 [Hevea brasiliensis]|uniref:Uncharacterized protein n=1 Tax=Hevea brasiliensis TaxID=3981 RepID=A0A6A6ND71_HEVBR|nr:hypothetical protein GH714_014759 [Hevea brasiliensis]
MGSLTSLNLEREQHALEDEFDCVTKKVKHRETKASTEEEFVNGVLFKDRVMIGIKREDDFMEEGEVEIGDGDIVLERVGHCEAFYSLDLDGKLNPVNTSDGGVHGSDDSDNLGEPKGQLVLGWLFNTKGGRFRVRIAIF